MRTFSKIVKKYKGKTLTKKSLQAHVDNHLNWELGLPLDKSYPLR